MFFYVIITLLILVSISAFLLLPSRNGIKVAESILEYNFQAKPYIFAHRGFHNTGFGQTSLHIPENSIAAIEMAINRGLAIEIDVQFSRDGELFVFHDDSLKRMTGVNKRLDRSDSETIHSLHLIDSNEKIPTLKEVLQLVSGKSLILLEIKRNKWFYKYKERLIDMIDAYVAKYQMKILVQSFDPRILYTMRKHMRGEVPCGLLTQAHFKKAGFLESLILSMGLLNVMARPSFISHRQSERPRFTIRFIHKVFHIPMLAWTVNKRTIEEYQKEYMKGTFESGKDKILYDGLIFEERDI